MRQRRRSAPLRACTLVTGATSGLGRAVAVRLARSGMNVAALGRSVRDLTTLEHELAQHGVDVLTVAVDLEATGTPAAVADRAAAELGGLAVVVNAAGTDVPASAEELSLEDWDRVVAVNLTDPFALAKAAFTHMRRGGGGLVVNISSAAGRRGWAGASAYCSTKFALTGLTQSLAAEGRDHDIRACVLFPGAMQTNWGTFDPTLRGPHPGPTDERRALDPAVVADLIAWMATSPGRPVLNEVTVTPLFESGWP